MAGLVSFRAVIDKGDLQELSARLGGMRKKIDAALKRPLNRTADKARSLIAKEIMALVNIKRKDLLGTGKANSRSKLISKSSIKYNTVTVTLNKTKRPQLMYFGAKDTGSGGWKNRKGNGVTYKISKTGPRKRIRDAFIVRAKGTQFVTRRIGEKRFPIAGPLRGPSPWGVYVKNNLGKQIRFELTGYLKKEVRAAINNVIRKQKK